MVREFYPLLPQGPLSNGITPPSWRRRGESREGLVVPGVDRSVRWGRSWGGRGGGWLFPGGSGTITQRCNGPLCLCPQLVPPVPLSHPITCSPWTLQPLQKPKVAIRGGTLVLVYQAPATDGRTAVLALTTTPVDWKVGRDASVCSLPPTAHRPQVPSCSCCSRPSPAPRPRQLLNQ